MLNKYFLTATKFLTVLGLIGGSLWGALALPGEAITIQSLESKTISAGPIYNTIQFFPGLEKDIWMMNQSHHGSAASEEKWERLAIVIDSKKQARFLQLPPGKLEWTEELLTQGTENRVTCFLCHSNGPRAIRPDPKFKIGWIDQLKIKVWNLRIKTYRRIQESSAHAVQDTNLKIPFRHRTPIDNEVLQVDSCTKCHSEKGLVQRGPLTRQNSIAIRFMVENKLMPPPGFELTKRDQKKIDQFLLGF